MSGMDNHGRTAVRGAGQPWRGLMVRAAMAALVLLALSSSAADWWQSYPVG